MSAVAAVAPRTIPLGTYTIVSEAGGHVTLRLRSAEWANDLPAGSVWVQVLLGPDNTNDYGSLGFVLPNGSIRSGKCANDARLAALSALLTGDFAAYGLAYALASKRCFRCGRALTHPDSIEDGMGPECRGKANTERVFTFTPGAPKLAPSTQVDSSPAAPPKPPARATCRVSGPRTLEFAWGVPERGAPASEWDLFKQRKEFVKGLGARWFDSDKVWRLTVMAGTEKAVSSALLGGAFAVDPAVGEMLGGHAERAVAFRKSATAKASDFEVNGINPRLSLRPFQRAGIEHAIAARSTILGDEMGLGKTVQAYGAAAHLGAWPMLCIVPANLKLNWKSEGLRWVDGLTEDEVLVLDTKPVPPSVLAGAKVVILSYQALVKQVEALKPIPWATVVADEAHMAKNPKTLRTKAIADLMERAQHSAKLRLMLTGTPVLNRPIELWPLIDILGYGDYFGGRWNYANLFCNAHIGSDGKWDFSGASNLPALSDLLRASGSLVRRRKVDVLTELPPLQYAPLPLPMTDPAVYWEAEEDVVHWYATMPERRARVASEAAKEADALGLLGNARALHIRQAIVDMFTKAEAAEQLIRFEALKQAAWKAKREAVFAWVDAFLEDTDKKIVLFAWHEEVVNALADRYSAPRIKGGMTGKAVEEAKARFQTDPACRVISCNLQAGGVGHTLTAASDVAVVEFPWNPSLLDQAAARIHRIGQTADSVTAWLLLAAGAKGEFTIDHEIAEVIDEKREVIDAVVDGDIPRDAKKEASTFAIVKKRWAARVAAGAEDVVEGEVIEAAFTVKEGTRV